MRRFTGWGRGLFAQVAGCGGVAEDIYDFYSSDQSKLIKQAIKDMGLSPENFQPAAVLSTISKAKNKLQTPAAFTQAAGGFFESNVARIYTKYESLLNENKAVDFDDLLLKTALDSKDNKEARELAAGSLPVHSD